MTAARVAADNDVVFKAVCYRATELIWKRGDEAAAVGILGAAKYVVPSLLEQVNLTGAVDPARADFDAFLGAAVVLEPEPREVALAAEMELLAQRGGVSLDTGESQLAAMVAIRSLDGLHTGDKRAIRALELLLDATTDLAPLQARVFSLEQLVASLDDAAVERLILAVCAEPLVDKALTYCCACHSPGGTTADSVRAGLRSYINDLRSDAPRLLAADSS